MARILIGVSGGIAAYKAVEFARLATLAGHGVRVAMTADVTRFVGAATFEGIVGSPVLPGEFTRDPMRGAYPGDASRARPDLPPRGRRERGRLRRRPRLREHDRQAGRRDLRLPADDLVPRLHRAADPRPGDERPDVGGRRHRRQRGDCCASAASRCSSPGRARSPLAASTATAGCPSRPRSSRRSRRRSAPIRLPAASRPSTGRRVLVTAGGTREADRPGPLHRQPLQRPDGRRPGSKQRRAAAPT